MEEKWLIILYFHSDTENQGIGSNGIDVDLWYSTLAITNVGNYALPSFSLCKSDVFLIIWYQLG